MNRGWRWWAKRAAIGAAGLMVAIQLVPYGRDHSNPAVVSEPDWDSARTRELAAAACFDCHSNEVNWPWYSNIAPISWKIQSGVDSGRDELNYSEYDPNEEHFAESAESVRDGEMPPGDYLILHPGARLSASEKQELIDGLVATFGDEGSD
ncbi:MAG: heme-binding domain-containing protein [Acidimicrobiia bacterium]|nr:heme-binding domain-containing protein [Acidimicrobiia bacterium]